MTEKLQHCAKLELGYFVCSEKSEWEINFIREKNLLQNSSQMCFWRSCIMQKPHARRKGGKRKESEIGCNPSDLSEVLPDRACKSRSNVPRSMGGWSCQTFWLVDSSISHISQTEDLREAAASQKCLLPLSHQLGNCWVKVRECVFVRAHIIRSPRWRGRLN